MSVKKPDKIEELSFVIDQPLPELIMYEDVLYTPTKLGEINKGEGDRFNTAINAAGNIISDVINARLNTAAKQILDGFKLTSSGALNISGTQTVLTANAAIGATSITVSSTTGFPSSGVLYLQGNTNWMKITYTGTTATTFTGIPASGTGSIIEAADSGKQVVGGPGVIATPKGIIAINSSGVETIALDGATGEITAIKLVGASGNIGGWAISATALYYDGATDVVSSGQSSVDYPFYAGKKYADRATAPYRVTPAGALVASSAAITGALNVDAIYYRKRYIYTTFAAVKTSLWYKSKDIDVIGGEGGILIQTGTTINDFNEIYNEIAGSAHLNFSKNPNFQTYLSINATVAQSIYFGIGDINPTLSKNSGIGFRIVDGDLYAIFAKDGTEYTTAIAGITLTNNNLYEVRTTSGTKIEFYINNVLKVTRTNTANFPTETNPVIFTYYVKTTAAVMKYIAPLFASLVQDL